MLKVNKRSEPEEFTKYKKKNKVVNWKDFTSESEIKKLLKEALLEEQENSCCPYCETEINLNDSQIEHIKPKDKFPELLIDYDNLIACCLESKRCGNSKANKWDELFINPVTENPEDYFKYFADGIKQQNLLLETYQNKQVIERNTLQDIYFDMGRLAGDRAFRYRNALLGHYVGLIRPHIGRDEIKSTDSDADADAILQETQYDKNVTNGADQRFERVTSGGVSKYNFNFSTQYEDFLYLGLNLNAHRINQKDKLSHWETYASTSTITNAYFENEYNTKGSGFSFQLGAIIKATKGLRLGVTYTSPTWYTFNQEYTQYLSTNNRRNYADPRVIVTLPDYKFRTPGSLTASAAYLFGKYAILSADYTYKDYKNLHFGSAAKNSENDLIENQLGETSTVRIGVEGRIPIKTGEATNYVSLRAGYRYEQSPYRKAIATVGDLTGYSFGAGVTLGGIRLDASYDIAKQTNLYQMYETVLTDNAQIKSTYGNFLFTFTAQLF